MRVGAGSARWCHAATHAPVRDAEGCDVRDVARDHQPTQPPVLGEGLELVERPIGRSTSGVDWAKAANCVGISDFLDRPLF